MLWQWTFAVPAQRNSIVSDSELATLLEYWLAFSDIPITRRLGTWCDGISLLHVNQLDRVTFSVSGVGYFPHDMAAFETEWHFQIRRDRIPQSVILRLGNVAHINEQSGRHNRQPERIFTLRPTIDSDWMVAVEMNEPEP